MPEKPAVSSRTGGRTDRHGGFCGHCLWAARPCREGAGACPAFARGDSVPQALVAVRHARGAESPARREKRVRRAASTVSIEETPLGSGHSGKMGFTQDR